MRNTNEKHYLIISEIGQQKNITSQKELTQQIEILFKDLGLTKNDIILLSSNCRNTTNIIQSKEDEKNNSNIEKNKYNYYKEKLYDNIKENYYLFSLTNRYEIFKQYFEIKFKSQIERNTFISSKDLFTGGIDFKLIEKNLNYSGQFINTPNNLILQKIIIHIKEIYTNYKSISLNYNSNICLTQSLLDNNINNIYNSLTILYRYYSSQIQSIKINFESLKTVLEEVSSRVESLEEKYKKIIIIKMGLSSKKETELFDLIINEKKIKQIKEKINNQLNFIKEKIANKSKKYEQMLNEINLNEIENRLKEIIDEKKLKEIKDNLNSIQNNFFELNKKYNKSKIEKDIGEIYQNVIDKNDLTFLKEEEFNILITKIKELKNNSEDILIKTKNFITESVAKKYFRFSSDIFISLNSIELFNKKFKSYINILETIDKENSDLLFIVNETLEFKFYYNEYERRINFIKDIKKTIIKLKNALKKENELRHRFNEELIDRFNSNINDKKLNQNNYLIEFFEWEDIKGNFDIYGDKYFNNVELDNDFYSNKNNIQILYEDNYQNENIFNLNEKIKEYKSENKKLKEKIEIKNKEFISQSNIFNNINNIFNDIMKNKSNDNPFININSNISSSNNKNKKSNLKESNKIFNPLYDELNEEDSFANYNNCINNINTFSSNDEVKESNSNKNKDIFLSLEQTFLIKKCFFNYFSNLISIKNEQFNKLLSEFNRMQMSLEDKYSQYLNCCLTNSINIYSIDVGTKNIFVKRDDDTFICLLLNKNEDSICEYFLDLNSLVNEARSFLNEEKNCYIIGTVSEIIKNNENLNKNYNEFEYVVFNEGNKKQNRTKKIVKLSKIEHLFCYQKDLFTKDIIIKNYKYN